ncbi:hypothetical protein Scep_017662 [Stephania cephalantha]|uniref:Glycosyltransferase family 92 protein n=1 Tax=Stephania cephalantha TaxID=152367 RepID=A0AAP0IQ03_9MAGN
MLSEQQQQRRRRKRLLRPPPLSRHCFRWSALFLLLLPTLFIYGSPHGSDLFRPVLRAFRIKPLLSVKTTFVPTTTTTTTKFTDSTTKLSVEDRVLFPDHVLLMIPNGVLSNSNLHLLECVYHKEFGNGSARIWELEGLIALPVISVDFYDDFRSIVRCPLPPMSFSPIVELRNRTRLGEGGRSSGGGGDGLVIVDNKRVHSWERMVYNALIDREFAVVFVKGLNRRPGRVSDPALFSCHFNWVDVRRSSNKYNKYVSAATVAVTAAQEVVRCGLPSSLRNSPSEAHGIRVSVSYNPRRQGVFGSRVRRRAVASAPPLPSVARLLGLKGEEEEGVDKFELCACTMVWNQAAFLREWIAYHAWLGVERWFIYDNNSDDETEGVIEELRREDYNVSRHVWPWIKTQEAGFSHCALRARNECKWMAFMDVDEFFYFKYPIVRQRKTVIVKYPDRLALRSLVANYSSSPMTIGEIRTVCHSFGPSGLSSAPPRGVTVGYTCRLQRPERHKSIVRLDALHKNLLNLVHHFQLRPGFKYLNLPQNIAVINHYKYQVWEVFKAKFFRRVATYVADWQESQNEGSNDRVPGLGTEAIEPPDWAHQFCEIWDTGLRDFVMATLADQGSGLLPWEKHWH